MIKTMTETNDNESAQLYFPIQLTPPSDDKSDDQLAAEMRVRIARQLNMVSAGKDVMDDELIDWINSVNALLMRGGYEPVPVDFRKFGVTKDSKPCLVSSTNI